MKNLSSDRLLQRLQQFNAAGAEARAIGDDEFAEECEDVARALRELLALREAGKEPVAWLWRWSDDAEGFWRYSEERIEASGSAKVKPLFAAPQLPAVPDGWVMVPRKLTAENGAKGALMGEFLESKYISCTECFGDDDCESCDGSGRVKVDVTVSWGTIKRIYSSSIDLFCKEGAAIAAAPKPEA